MGSVAQWVSSVIADPGVVSLIPARPHTFVEIDHEIVSAVILLLPLIQEGLLSVCERSTGEPLIQSLPRKSVVGLTDSLNMTIAVDVKPQTKSFKCKTFQLKHFIIRLVCTPTKREVDIHVSIGPVKQIFSA